MRCRCNKLHESTREILIKFIDYLFNIKSSSFICCEYEFFIERGKTYESMSVI